MDGYTRCFRCNQHANIPGVADLVAPLIYGIERTQSGILLRHYKDDVSPEARQQHSRVISRLLLLGILLHEKCIEKRVGQVVTSRVTVPSTKGRSGIHPFDALARNMNAVDDSLILVPATGATNDRNVDGARFGIHPQRSLQGEHVLVLDDTWTTGARTQSAALTLRNAGADHVSIMVLGRWVSRSFGNNIEYLKANLTRDYSPRICPVTGGDCP